MDIDKIVLHSLYGRMGNPGFNFNHDEEKRKEIEQLIEDATIKRIIPEAWPQEVESMCNGDLRFSFTGKSSFSLVAYDWVKALNETVIRNKKCLEVMCGTGMLSKALQDIGVHCKATDNNSWFKHEDSNIAVDWDSTFTEIEEIDCVDAIKKYGADTDIVIMCWPYMNDLAYRVLVEYKKINPDGKLVYIGELDGGCTANDEFFAEARKYLRNPNYIRTDAILRKYRQWYGIHDTILVI